QSGDQHRFHQLNTGLHSGWRALAVSRTKEPERANHFSTSIRQHPNPRTCTLNFEIPASTSEPGGLKATTTGRGKLTSEQFL
ncbi:MAG TPA: hypothetical protein VD835_12475, partial [Pyrinomonadaceae bacterium]|nr:hypothetical protein [Pyrinomonadaceae bacterium]